MLRSDNNILSSRSRTRTSITNIMCVLLLTLSAITASSISFAEEKKEDKQVFNEESSVQIIEDEDMSIGDCDNSA